MLLATSGSPTSFCVLGVSFCLSQVAVRKTQHSEASRTNTTASEPEVGKLLTEKGPVSSDKKTSVTDPW